LFDIDHFKQVNDTFGHPVGDRVLVKIAQTIRQEIRKADIFGRVGGEEFLLLLPKISVDNASCFAERIRSRVAELQWDDTPIAKPITISLGITQYHQKDSLEDLIARADQALYQAKHKGRNCWVKLVAANASN
jgi:diguanylate cyclase (GGDEF)-like protein